MLAMAAQHSLSPSGWQSQWPSLDALRSELETKMGSAAFQKIWAKGRNLDPDTIVTSWLETDNVSA